MKSSFLPWLLAHLVYCRASTISQHGAVKWNSVGKTIKQSSMIVSHALQLHTKKAVANNDDSKGSAKYNIVYAYRITQLQPKQLLSKCHSALFGLPDKGLESLCAGTVFQQHLGFYNDIKGSGHRLQVLEHHDFVDEGKGGKQWACLFGNMSKKQTPADHEPKLTKCPSLWPAASGVELNPGRVTHVFEPHSSAVFAIRA